MPSKIDKRAAQRQATQRQKFRDLGWKSVNCWVPRHRRAELLALAAKMRAEDL